MWKSSQKQTYNFFLKLFNEVINEKLPTKLVEFLLKKKKKKRELHNNNNNNKL